MMVPAWRFTNPATRITRLAWPCYAFDGRQIIQRCYRRQQGIVELSAIVTWHVDYEMVFDRVTLVQRGADHCVWLDYDNDLLKILRERIPTLEI